MQQQEPCCTSQPWYLPQKAHGAWPEPTPMAPSMLSHGKASKAADLNPHQWNPLFCPQESLQGSLASADVPRAAPPPAPAPRPLGRSSVPAVNSSFWAQAGSSRGSGSGHTSASNAPSPISSAPQLQAPGQLTAAGSSGHGPGLPTSASSGSMHTTINMLPSAVAAGAGRAAAPESAFAAIASAGTLQVGAVP